VLFSRGGLIFSSTMPKGKIEILQSKIGEVAIAIFGWERAKILLNN